MPEDDFLMPRRSPSSVPESGIYVEPESAHGVHIDPRVLEERRRRKERLTSQPKTVDAETDKPWRYLDRRWGEVFSTYEEPMWTLCDATRWVAERTREAVDGLSIDEERLAEVLPEIHGALAAGEVRAWAHTPNDPVPRELPSETWAIYQLAIEELNGLLFIVPVLGASPNQERALLDVRLSREGVLRRWPDDQGKTPSPPAGTVGAEYSCRSWLIDLVKTDPHNPRPKGEVRKEAKGRFPALSNRGFDRAWTWAINEAGA